MEGKKERARERQGDRMNTHTCMKDMLLLLLAEIPHKKNGPYTYPKRIPSDMLLVRFVYTPYYTWNLLNSFIYWHELLSVRACSRRTTNIQTHIKLCEFPYVCSHCWNAHIHTRHILKHMRRHTPMHHSEILSNESLTGIVFLFPSPLPFLIPLTLAIFAFFTQTLECSHLVT